MPNELTIGLGEEMMLLRGSSLRNTGHIWGIAVYTGHDSKVMMNSAKSSSKKSKLEITLNKYLLMGIAIQMILCMVGALTSGIWNWYEWRDLELTPYYLELNYTYAIQPDGTASGVQYHESPAAFINMIQAIAYSFGKWVLALMNFVAISLLVSLETVKFC